MSSLGDAFQALLSALERLVIARRRYTTSAVPGLENIRFPVATAEDTIRSKSNVTRSAC